MILEQHYIGSLPHASYLIADERSGAAAVVDLRRDVDRNGGASTRATGAGEPPPLLKNQ